LKIENFNIFKESLLNLECLKSISGTFVNNTLTKPNPGYIDFLQTTPLQNYPSEWNHGWSPNTIQMTTIPKRLGLQTIPLFNERPSFSSLY
jgi:hypothetical protein